jgi:hypothetical protein
VAWNISSSHVSWVPLAPGEIYYGRRDYGPQSVNINQVNINIQKNFYINGRVKDAVVTVQKDSFSKRNPVKVTQVDNPFLKPANISISPTEKPFSVGDKKTPSRFINESVKKVQSERKPLLKEWEKDSKGIEQKQITEGSGKKTVSEIAQNRGGGAVQSNHQINSSPKNAVEKNSISVPTGEKANSVRKSSGALTTTRVIQPSNPSAEQRGNISNGVKGENKVSDQEGNKNKKAPIVPAGIVKASNEKESKPKDRMKVESPNPIMQSSERKALSSMNQDRSERIGQSNSNKENLEQRNQISSPPKDKATAQSSNPGSQSPQRMTSVSVNQNRNERAGESNSFTSLPARQEGKASAGRPSLPEGGLSTAPTTKEHTNSFNRGSKGGFSGTSPVRSFH